VLTTSLVSSTDPLSTTIISIEKLTGKTQLAIVVIVSFRLCALSLVQIITEMRGIENGTVMATARRRHAFIDMRKE
jgi:hypothetical protein